MGPIFNSAVSRCQGTETDLDAADRSMAVDRYLTLLRECVLECGWTYEALAVEMAERLERPTFDKAFLWKLLNGEKPLRIEHLLALPDDVEVLFESKRAESLGLIVAEPAA